MLDAIIFDMDGVIIDSEPFFIEAENILLKRHGHNVPWEYHFQFQGTTHDYMWKLMKQDYHLDDTVKNLVNEATVIRESLIKDKGLTPIPGVLDFITKIKNRNIPLAVASSSPKKDIVATIETFNLQDDFSFLVSGEEVENSKPFPDIFIAAAHNLDVLPDNCVVIEDSRNGVIAGKKAGMKVIGYRNPNFPPQDLSAADIITSDFTKLTFSEISELTK